MKGLLLFFVLISPLFALSQQDPIGLFKQFNGHFDFTAFGNTLNEFDNSVNASYCDMLSESSATLNLSPEQTMVSAHLYWGSIGTGDLEVDINGTTINAERTFNYYYNGKPFFGAYTDVTDLVAATGDGNYTFSGLDVMDIIHQYCGQSFGGWAIYVIYEDPNLLLNQISLFDGLEGVWQFNPSLNITLTGLDVSSDQLSKIGFLAWEGDEGNSIEETLRINGQLIADPPLNPADNLFNGTNSYIGPPENSQNYNMDLDHFDLTGIVAPGDTTIEIELHSGFDFIMVNNIITSINSELPDATITIDNLGVLCEDRNMEVNYTVSNVNSTAALPANVPIAFYANAVLLGQPHTLNELPIDGTESGTINLNIPVGTPPVFTLKAVVDDDGTGNSTVMETNEDNNEFDLVVDLTEQGLFITGNNESCEGQTETLTANFDDLDVYDWFRDGNPYGGNTPTIEVTESGVYTVSGNKAACFVDESPGFTVTFNPQPVPSAPEDLYRCDNGTQTNIFDLTSREAQILNGNNWDLTYFESYDDAVNQEDAIPANETTEYQNTSNPQTIYVRVTNPDSGCFEIVELELIVNPLPDDSAEVSDYIICAADDSEIGIFNLETKVPEILGEQTDPPFTVSFYLDQDDAENQTNAIQNTTAHQNKDANNNAINPQTIYVGIVDADTGCYIGGGQSFDLIVQQGASAVAPTEPFVICDNLPPMDGYAEFNLDDLTDQQVADLHAEILADQDPAVYEITFHETLEQAETGTNAITFPYVNITNPQVIYVRVTNNDSQYEPKCYAVVEMMIEVEQLPEVILDDQYRLCVDENGNPIPEEEGSESPPVIDTGLDPVLFTFVWEMDGVIIIGETGPSIIVLEAGEYTVTYTEIASSCQNSVSTTVFISSPPFTYDANVVSDAFAGSHIIEVTSDGEGTYHYQLDNGPFQESGTFETVSPGTHLITIKDIYGCGSITIEVGVIDYPPYFTPNEDGYHDTWNIIGIGEFDPTAKVYIFDRFGKLLKQLSPLGPGWDGTYIGNPMPSSDYWFRVEYTEDGNAKEFKGHFTLKR